MSEVKDRTFEMFLSEDESYVYTRNGGLTSDDKYPNGVSSSLITFMRDDGVEIVHSVSARIGIGWAIRHARGIGTHKRVLWWKVVLGNGVTIAESRYKELL